MANVKRVYLCKSDRTSSATLRIVRDALSKYECDVVEHKRGDTYDHEAKDNLLEADFLLVCPPVIGKYVVTPREYRRYDKIGKGQIEQINDFSWEKGTKDQIYMILDRDLETDGLYLGRVTSTHVSDSDNWIEHGEVYTSPNHHDHLPEIFSLQGISMKGARQGGDLRMNAHFVVDGTSREGHAFAKGELCRILGDSKMNYNHYRILPNKIMTDPKAFWVVHKKYIRKWESGVGTYVDPMIDLQTMLDIRNTQDPEWCERTDVPPIKYKAGTHTILHRKHKPMLALYKRLKG